MMGTKGVDNGFACSRNNAGAGFDPAENVTSNNERMSKLIPGRPVKSGHSSSTSALQQGNRDRNERLANSG